LIIGLPLLMLACFPELLWFILGLIGFIGVALIILIIVYMLQIPITVDANLRLSSME